MNQYRSLKDHVYDYIASLISEGRIHGGDKLSEQRICDDLGVSRTPVREALIQLASDGYLENFPRKGFCVKQVNEDSAREIFEILGPLDGRAAFLACDSLTEADHDRLAFVQESMALAIDKGLVGTYNELQHEFHDIYVSRCGNHRLISMITQLNRFFMRREYASLGDERAADLLRKANNEHAVIVDLLKKGDKEGVQSYIRDVHWNIANAKFVAW